MSRYLTIDFGSTYTKAVLFDLDAAEVLGVGYAPSTVGDDVRKGLAAALVELGDDTAHDLPCLACSSAAGGLRIIAVGLVPTLSLEAARRAALGAGGKVIGAYGYKLTAGDLEEIASGAPDILLLAGGTDGGDEETITYNAARLAELKLEVPVIVAGNKTVSLDCAGMIEAAGITAILTPNILPEVDRLNVEPVHARIREIFMERIVHAKGIDLVGDEVDLVGPIVPTPRAILDAANLISEGSGDQAGVGDVLVVDIGGATTDVHSIASGLPRTAGVVQRGLPELHAKRTVEGDLGMRVSAPSVLERAGEDMVAARYAELTGRQVEQGTIATYAERLGRETNHIPGNDQELALDAAIASSAAHLAMIRHAGHIREVVTATGPVMVQEGKDLTGTQMIIGVGGVLAHGPHEGFVLHSTCNSGADPCSLLPRTPRLMVDRQYVLFGVGLLAERFPTPALNIAHNTLSELATTHHSD